MKRCLDSKDIVLLASDQLDKKEIKKLLHHVKSCKMCRRKVERYKKALDEFEDFIKYYDRGGG